MNITEGLWEVVKINGKVMTVLNLKERKPQLLDVVFFACFLILWGCGLNFAVLGNQESSVSAFWPVRPRRGHL